MDNILKSKTGFIYPLIPVSIDCKMVLFVKIGVSLVFELKVQGLKSPVQRIDQRQLIDTYGKLCYYF